MEDQSDSSGPTVELPSDWPSDIAVDDVADGVRVVRPIADDGRVSPYAIEASQRPILVTVHYGRSAIVPTRIDAIRFGYRESSYHTEFYYLDIVDDPQWVKITEESGEEDRGILSRLDEWVADGTLTEAEADWARAQFE
jgi:hypothetical protein